MRRPGQRGDALADAVEEKHEGRIARLRRIVTRAQPTAAEVAQEEANAADIPAPNRAQYRRAGARRSRVAKAHGLPVIRMDMRRGASPAWSWFGGPPRHPNAKEA